MNYAKDINCNKKKTFYTVFKILKNCWVSQSITVSMGNTHQ